MLEEKKKSMVNSQGRKMRKLSEANSLLKNVLPFVSFPAKKKARNTNKTSTFLSQCIHCHETNRISNKCAFKVFPTITTKCGACSNQFEAKNPRYEKLSVDFPVSDIQKEVRSLNLSNSLFNLLPEFGLNNNSVEVSINNQKTRSFTSFEYGILPLSTPLPEFCNKYPI